MKLFNTALIASSVLADENIYKTPVPAGSVSLFESFDSADAIDGWTRSDNEKYAAGKWVVEPLAKEALEGDQGLVIKKKAAHHALANYLEKPFSFDSNFVAQYEVAFQNGIECGGGYMKLLTQSDEDLVTFDDKTPFTIMFGPDKCGADYKLHFIFRYKNPVTGEITERSPSKKADHSELQKKFSDNKPHVYRLEVNTDNTFAVSIDNKVVMSGNLLEDISPSIIPEKEINDPEDKKPASWDERERIADPEASKPEEWDETAPTKIPDENAVKPDGWLDDEEALIADPDSVMPDDWDEEMDGEWEAPLIENELCKNAPGCGTWARPEINNPAYKGKWKAPMIDNPDYDGKWAPRKIANPEYFDDATPHKMMPIGAIGLELWTLSDDIYFDNIYIGNSADSAKALIEQTWTLRKKQNSNVLTPFVEATEGRPWLWAVYVLAVIIPLFGMIIYFCCSGDSKEDEVARKKKTDEPTEDDPHESDVEEKIAEQSSDEEPQLEGDEEDIEPTEQGDAKEAAPAEEDSN